jgi:predicted O-methyltransferase YrrM
MERKIDERWTRVDEFLDPLCVPADPVLDDVLAASSDAHLPPIQVSPLQGKFLMLLVQLQRARRVLEIGTLGGYSTIWMARALEPGGSVMTLELDPRHADIATRNFARAGLAARVDLRLGPALRTLAELPPADRQPFDLIFIDADKVNTAGYFAEALTLSRPGTLIVIDNVIRDGAIADAHVTEANARAMRAFLTQLSKEPRVTATALQTVSQKGYDGFAIARVNG